LYRRIRFGYAFRKIPLTKGKFAIVDPDDYERLSKYKWHAERATRTFYAARSIYVKNGRNKHIAMHREIIKAPDGIFIDHINHNGLDNRKANLRLATRAQNGFNRLKTLKKTWSTYKGVFFHTRHKKWQARIVTHGQAKHLGTFANENDAAKAYDNAARKYHGEFAVLNFPTKKSS